MDIKKSENSLSKSKACLVPQNCEYFQELYYMMPTADTLRVYRLLSFATSHICKLNLQINQTNLILNKDPRYLKNKIQ